MRILMTADAVGGVWPYALDLATGLRHHGIEVTIAVLGPAPSCDQRRVAAETGCRLVALDAPLDWLATGPRQVLEAEDALAALAAGEGADLVHLHGAAYAAGRRFAMPVVSVCHSCVATWWDAVETGPLPNDLAWRRELVARGLRHSAAVVAPTQAFAADTARIYDLAVPPRVIRHGRRTDRGPQPAMAAGPAVFGAGRVWDRGKNFAALDRVAARLDCPVVVAGAVEGPHGERVVTDHLRLVGHLDDAAMTVRLRDRPVFASLALYEPFGLAVLEAAAAGCALVLSDRPGFRELWDGAAVFVDAGDAIATARTIGALAADPDARARWGEAARAKAAAHGLETMTGDVVALFRSLLPARGLDASAAGAAA